MNILKIILLCTFLFETQLHAVHSVEEYEDEDLADVDEYIPRRYLYNLEPKLLILGPSSLYKTYESKYLRGTIENQAFVGEREFVNCVQKTLYGKFKRVQDVFKLKNYGGDPREEKIYERDAYTVSKRTVKSYLLNVPYTLRSHDGKSILKIRYDNTTLYCISLDQEG